MIGYRIHMMRFFRKKKARSYNTPSSPRWEIPPNMVLETPMLCVLGLGGEESDPLYVPNGMLSAFVFFRVVGRNE